jgi:hypothetical protein
MTTPMVIAPVKNTSFSRNFFGVIKVFDTTRTLDGHRYAIRTVQHGSTLHGMQVMNDPMETEPVSYFGREAPVGDIFATLKPRTIAVIGLGAGTLACYATPIREFTFIEIDPAVIKMAQTRFTYLDKCRGAKPHRIIEGDGRLAMSRLSEHFDLIIVDAFSSDMVPVHLVSRDAIEVYMERLNEGGMIAFHISNNYVELARVLAASARAAGLRALYKFYAPPRNAPFLRPTEWLVITRQGTATRELEEERLWVEPETKGQRPWTDTYSSIISVLRF